MQASPLPPAEFVTKAQEKGFVFSVKPGNRLGVKPPAPGAMTEGMRRYVSTMKPELLRLLRSPRRRAALPAALSASTDGVDLLEVLLTAEALLKEGRLSSDPWQKSQGVLVEDPARWFGLRLDQVVACRRSVASPDDPQGDSWARTRYGRRIAEDLIEFALWYSCASLISPETVEGHFVSFCASTRTHTRERAQSEEQAL